MGKPLGSFQILRQVASSLVSVVVIDVGESAIRRCVCMILELAMYRRRRCFISGGRWVARTILLMVDKASVVHLIYSFGLWEAVRVVPK